MANYSKEFNEAFDRLAAHEGWGKDGGNYDSQDKGGRHRWGISQRANPDLNLDTLTKDDAKRIFKERYWDTIGADNLPPGIRATAFDAAVNQGPGFARRALQDSGGDPEAFNQLRADRYDRIVERDPSQERYLKGWMNRLNSYRGAPQQASPQAAGDGYTGYIDRNGEWPEQEAYERSLYEKSLQENAPAPTPQASLAQVGQAAAETLPSAARVGMAASQGRAPGATQRMFDFLSQMPPQEATLSGALRSLMAQRQQPAARQPVQVNQPAAAANFQQALDQPQWDPFGGSNALSWNTR